MDIRREFPDAIEESVVFDHDEVPQPQAQSREPANLHTKPVSEAPDPRQAESVLARVRALTRQRHLRMQPLAPVAAQTGTQQLMPKQPEEFAATWPAEKPRPSPIRTIYPADSMDKDIVSVLESRVPRPAPSGRNANAQGNARRENERDTVQVNFGSIVVHVEPEAAPAPQAPQPARQRPTAYSATDADNRWTRSFLDRN